MKRSLPPAGKGLWVPEGSVTSCHHIIPRVNRIRCKGRKNPRGPEGIDGSPRGLMDQFTNTVQYSTINPLEVEKFVCTNFRDKNFRESLFLRIYHKNSLTWKMKYSYMHQFIKETFLQGFDYRLCL